MMESFTCGQGRGVKGYEEFYRELRKSGTEFGIMWEAGKGVRQ
jgi:hypothetical protein